MIKSNKLEVFMFDTIIDGAYYFSRGFNIYNDGTETIGNIGSVVNGDRSARIYEVRIYNENSPYSFGNQ